MRIYKGNNVPLDFCDNCAPSEALADALYSDGIGPDGRDDCYAYDAEHPSYDSGEFYCHGCRERLVLPPSSGLLRATRKAVAKLDWQKEGDEYANP
jgi:hypothetical protein